MAFDTGTKMTMAALTAAATARIPVMLVGSPGTGKTAAMRELAEEMGYRLITLVGSYCDPTDIVGLPKGEKIIENEDGSAIWGTSYLMPWWQVEIITKKKVILFLDEFSNTAAATRASMLTMLQNREFPNGEMMPPETIVIGAMNATEDAADGYELDLPTTNRLLFLNWSPSFSSWAEGMRNAWGDKDVSQNEMKWRRKIVNFIEDNPAQLHVEPKDVVTTAAYGFSENDTNAMEISRSAWASRRSWDNLAKVLGNAPDDVSIQDLIAVGLVGYSASTSFRDWLRKHETIDPREVIEDPASVDWKAVDLDDANLVLRAVLDIAKDTVEAEGCAKIIGVFDKIADEDRCDLGGPYITDLLKVMTDKGHLVPAVINQNRNLLTPTVKKYSSISKHAQA